MQKNRFFKRIKLTPEILGKIAKIDEFKGIWQGGLNLNPQILGKLKKSVIIASSGSSTRIEGVEMSDQEVARLLRGLKSREPKNRDEQEVAGYADLLGRIFDNHKTFKLLESRILQFHNIMLKFSKKDIGHRGQYKKTDNIVVAKDRAGRQKVLFRPTPPHLVKAEMDNILFWTNQELEKDDLHNLLVIANFIFEFLAIHPFHDGNGRLSRAMTNWLLLRSGYSYIPYVSMEEIVEDKQADYYLSLRVTQKNHKTKQENITSWLNFFLDVLVAQANKAREIMQKKQPETMLSEKQEKIYELFNGENILGVLEIDKKLKRKIPKVTIKQALSRLVVLGLIERIGLGRGTRYRKFN